MVMWLAASALALADNTDKWTQHLAYQEAESVVVAGEKIYALYGRNLLEYNTADDEVSPLSTLTGLCEMGITKIGFDQSLKTLVVLYSTGNIDFIDTETDEVYNMPTLKRVAGGVITINNLNMADGEAVIATSEGVVRVDIAGRELIAYYKLGENVTDATVANGVVYAALPEQLRCCLLDNNPLDPASWTTLRENPVTVITTFGDAAYFQIKWSGLYYAKRDTITGEHTSKRISTGTVTRFSHCDSTLLAVQADKCQLIEKNTPDAIAKEWAQNSTTWKGVALASDNVLWTAENTNGVCQYTLNADTTALDTTGLSIGNIGPKRDLCYYTTFADGRLLVAGGRLDPADKKRFPPFATIYENNEWKIFGETGVDIDHFDTRGGYTSIVQDPNDPTHHYVSSAGFGLIEYHNYEIAEYYNTHNSPLKSAASNGSQRYVRIDGLCYDPAGNLWMLNNGQDTVIKVLKTDGEWMGIYAQSLQYAPTLEKAMFDSKGRFWACSRGTGDGHTSGLFCLYFNGNINKAQNDKQMFRSAVNNQDGRACVLENVYCIAEDQNGEIWFGNSSGLYVISNPDEWASSNFLITQIKVPRNDGTNLADYLLSGVSVTAIAVDGANRKWIGTETSGLYLVSPDGTEILENFTVENSPLLDNNILSLSIDKSTGEVFVGTNMGLMSYRSGIVEAAEKLKENNILVYPNPVRPEYTGNVTVNGLTDGAEVRITTLGGQVVAHGYSTGGTFTWNCCGIDGERVATGVYLVLATTAEGKDGVAAKIVVI